MKKLIHDYKTVGGLDIFQLARIILTFDKDKTQEASEQLNNALVGMSEIWTQNHLAE